jgi:formate hydrogenlyase transcriptional activator
MSPELRDTSEWAATPTARALTPGSVADPLAEAKLETLRGVTRHMATVEDLPTVLQSITTAIVEHAGAAVAHIFLYLRDDECPVCRTGAPRVASVPDERRPLHLLAGAGMPFGVGDPVHRIGWESTGPSAELIRTPVPTMIQDVADDPRWVDEPAMQALLRSLGIKGLVCLPLAVRGEPVGAMGYLTRDVVDPQVVELLGIFADQAAMAIRSAQLFAELASHKERLQVENSYLQEEIRVERGFEHIVGASSALGGVLRKVRQVSPVETTVLLMGETGTGKELVARAIHDASPRKDRPLIKINCGAIPQGIVESELFGHEKGAFTGAVQRRIGRFELADRGTLFMDEVGELPLDTQVKLLRVLQEQEFERVGSTKPIKVDVRLIAATNRDVAREVAEGRFRADLFYRLNVFPIRIPPLRERVDDIPRLVDYFLAHFQRKMGKPLRGVTDNAMEQLTRYAWPGNIRELQNVLERACVLATGPRVSLGETLRAATPTPAGAGAPASQTLLPLEESERAHIRRALAATSGRIHGPGGAAERLGINPSTLRSRMQKLGISAKG